MRYPIVIHEYGYYCYMGGWREGGRKGEGERLFALPFDTAITHYLLVITGKVWHVLCNT